METNYFTAWDHDLAEQPEIQDPYASVIASRLQDYEEMMFQFIMNLCV